jgi:putative inorganic carbon (HCO3(-)) transporter
MADTRDRAHRRASFTVTVLLAALAFWLPLPFGSAVVWAHLVLQLGAFLLLAIAALALPAAAAPRRALVPAAAVASLAVLAFAQAAPWPPAIVRTLSPEHARLQEQAARGLAAAGSPAHVASTFSLAPEATREAALTWLAVAACGAVAAGVGSRRQGRRVLFAALLGAAAVQIGLGTAWLASRSQSIWGIAVAGDPTRLRGTFVNADHLAYLLELSLAGAFAWVWWALGRARWESAPERRVLLVAPPMLAWVTVFVALAFTGSRAGLIAGLSGTLAQGLAVASLRRRLRLGLSGLLAAAVGLGAVAAVSVQQGLGRWLATSQYELSWSDRQQVYALTLQLFQRYPLLGSGLATFRDAFPAVQPPELAGAYWHAHNDYAELLATMGVVGTLLAVVAAGAVVRGLARSLERGQRSEDRAAALAAAGGLAAVAVHSCLDFGLSMPANAAWLVILLSAALAVPLLPRSARA